MVRLTDNGGGGEAGLVLSVKPMKGYVLYELINLEKMKFNCLSKDSLPPTSQLVLWCSLTVRSPSAFSIPTEIATCAWQGSG